MQNKKTCQLVQTLVSFKYDPQAAYEILNASLFLFKLLVVSMLRDYRYYGCGSGAAGASNNSIFYI